MGFSLRVSRTVRPAILVTLAWVAIASPASAKFIAPNGWSATTVSGSNVYQSPHAIGGFYPNINISSSPSTSSDDLSRVSKRFASLGPRFSTDQEVTCVPGYHARWIEYETTMLNRRFSYVQLVAETSSTIAILTYTRPAGTDEDPAAIKSLLSFCGR